LINTIEIKEDSRLESLAKNRTAVWFPDGFFQASVRGFEHNRAIGPLISHISAIFAGNFADVLDASVDFDVIETYGVFLEQRIGTLSSSSFGERITISLINDAIRLDVKWLWISSSTEDLLSFPRLTEIVKSEAILALHRAELSIAIKIGVRYRSRFARDQIATSSKERAWSSDSTANRLTRLD